ncbi:MAG: acyl-CoA dehydrogenase [Chloroflexi bacterium]|nr:acyl-CoA dehydrogenase family protein [Anaerolineales bacterium]MCQ3954810.1 acyl-CoA dehydrogenase [Chloroflexota bacterium]RIK49090.1 MAG: acyl-CoA dehydrogenase [Chloroflexota bacterium]
MDLLLTEEQKRFRDSVRSFVDKEVVPAAQEMDEKGEFPRALFGRCAANGYFALRYPESVGGMDADFLTYCLMMEEIARGSLSLGAAVAMQTLMGTDLVARFGTDDHRQRLLAPALRGEKIGTIAMTEPDFGSDLGGITTRAIQMDGGWEITGRKMWITSATVADFFTVAAKTDPEAGFKGIDFFLVEKERAGVRVGRKIEKMGVRASETSELILERVRVPAENMLGKQGTGFKNLGDILCQIRVMTGALALGLGEAALRSSIKYSNERVQSGQTIANYQAVSHKIAEMGTRLEAARALVYQVAKDIDAGRRDVKLASMAKLFSTETANFIADECTRIHGSYGFAMEYDAQRYYRDARFLLYGGGTSEVLRNVISKAMGAPESKKA